ncbi:hypothetical protein [Clostridium tagluense]|uniref:hypothetical protein n=1 Tax=Clostridium tagluense TaxID=360422 RepID=UPI001C0D3B29|nr:hypothetical protein [Clostridium tagluense]MBU3126728.1 hypothetical protein [Clostridium tagluense]
MNDDGCVDRHKRIEEKLEAVLNLGHTKEAVVKIADIPLEAVKVEIAPAIVKYFAPDGITELQPIVAQ